MKTKSELITLGALVALAGFVLSGPVGFLLVQIIKPQPAWTNATDFVANYNTFQDIPYYFGFILVGGMLLLSAAHYINVDKEKDLDKLHVLLALIWTTIFSALIFFNYICQTTFIRHLVRNYKPEYDRAIETFSMANPDSLSWSVEMWGYAFLGIATWLLSSFYREKNRLIYVLLVTNGIVSVLSVILFVLDAHWLLSIPGLAGYFLWNLLMIVLLFFIYKHAKKYLHEN